MKWIWGGNCCANKILSLRKEFSYRQNIIWHKSYQCFIKSVSQGNRNKNKQMGHRQTYKLVHSKGNHKENKRTTYRMGENICKWCNRWRLNLQNIQTAHRTQQQQQMQSKIRQKTETDIPPKETQMAHEKMSGEGIQKREPSYTVSGNILINMCRRQGEQHRGSPKN